MHELREMDVLRDRHNSNISQPLAEPRLGWRPYIYSDPNMHNFVRPIIMWAWRRLALTKVGICKENAAGQGRTLRTPARLDAMMHCGS